MDRKLRSESSLDSTRPEQAPESLTKMKPAPITPGELIGGRYRVERVIAEGGMGIIVAARHVELEEIVAIKFLKHEFVINPEIVGRFAREAKAAARIKSQHTATVHDVGTSSDHGPYIVMEYLEGRDLESLLAAEGRLPVAHATELVMQAGEALACAHALGIIHRDIKPANLFLVSNNEVPTIKVLDFGVSKTALTGTTFGGSISLVKTQSLLGSPIYMAPEQIRGGQEVSFRSDVWSLGAVLYELVTGSTPFTGQSITELCAAVLETQPKPISDNVPEVPAGLVDAIMRCLEKDPALRFGSVAELITAIAPFAPKRARLCVERAIAVSKSAGLVASHFAAPLTLPPPPSSSGMPLAMTSSPPISTPSMEVDNGGRTKRGLLFGVIAAVSVAGITTAALQFSRRADPPPPAPTVAATHEPPTAEPTAATPILKTPTATAKSVEPARAAAPPVTNTPVVVNTNTARPQAPRSVEPRPVVNRAAPPPPAATPSASQPAPVVTQEQPPAKKADPVRSAIDDRK